MKVSSLAAAFAIGNGCASFASAQSAEPMIVGGIPAEVGAYPYYVDMDGCGASLIAPGVVLSAAHCVDGGFNYIGKTLIVGGYDRQQVTNGAVSATVTNEINHPSWDTWAGTMEYDIMLLQLDSPVTTSGTVKLGLNPEFTTPSAGQVLTIIGNGNTQEDGEQSDVLLEAEVLAVDTDTCNQPYQGEIYGDVMFCAGAKGKDSCQGDSGGPIVVVDGDTHTQVGVVSFGYGCSRPGIPGVYARVSSVMSWIAYVTCTCWGVDDPDICSFLDANDNFSCENTGGGERPGGDTGTGPSGCELVAGWTDNYGDGCGWFEQYDTPGCPETGYIPGNDGITAAEACCHCQKSGEADGCLLIADWFDTVGDSCGWYEINDSPGCPNFGSITGTGGATAWQACCHCEGGGSGSNSDAAGCQLIDGWVDIAGDACGWYEQNDSSGCPEYGYIEGTGGVLAWDACCHCEGGKPEPGCQLISGWVDNAGDSCAWYELNESQGCPNFGDIPGTGGAEAWDACCHCEGGRPDSGTGVGCELVAGWRDVSGDTCSWYEQNDSEGCPVYGSVGGTDNIAAWDGCCHCQGGGPNTDPGCQLVEGWTDFAGDSCAWYEDNDAAGCPEYGNTEGTNGIPAWQACCHCGGNSSVVDGCQLISGWIDAEFGSSCGYLEAVEAAGCPELGETSIGIDGSTANEACCHCAGITPAPETPVPGTGATPSPAPVATPTNSPSGASHFNFSVATAGLLAVIFISLTLM